MDLNNSGQGALEYLMTYSWALVVILVIIGVLAYLGVFNSGGSIETCTGFPVKFTYTAHQYKSIGEFTLAFSSILSHKIQVTKIKEDATGKEKTFAPAVEFLPGNIGTINAFFAGGMQGQNYNHAFTLNYDEFADDGSTIAYQNKLMQVKCTGKYE